MNLIYLNQYERKDMQICSLVILDQQNLFFLCPFLRKEVSTVANRIMGITVEIGGDTTKLQTKMSLARTAFGWRHL